ncbi:zinc-binding alcohol dehydrogenase family protein [Pseudomaricurvus sp.]|uniref:zinc-binding alcohol dehydrogenase family protein n=1 Tax=Pseudomaricurvus sp. TaxID=2004510 RepID=UPI003F6C7187
MKAVGLYQYLPIDDEQALMDVTLDQPAAPQGQDILVAVKAISVNPVDTKIRSPKDQTESSPRVLGWDAAGEVVAVGPDVKHHQVGDKVYYAGDITRPGSNSEFQRVDERIVGKMPKSLDFAQAAALPLTSITAWEALFDRMGICPEGRHAGRSILIVGAAGGVGSIAIQLAKQFAKLNVIATASRDDTTGWVKRMGADQVINHRNSLDDELKGLGVDTVDYILCLNATDQHWVAMANAIAPQGHICSIVETEQPVDLGLLKSKSASFSWEFMFTRAMFNTEDMIEQQKLLNKVAEGIDQGVLQGTLKERMEPINAENLRKAHSFLESGKAIGKLVLTGWD